ncbi:MAG: hypothetical protein AAF495_22125 [Pseudomonadota bacterium]
MSFKRKLIATTIIAGLGLGAGQAHAVGEYDPPVSFDLTFNLHIDDDLAEQDIFVEKVPGSGQVYRPTVGERDLSLPLYSTAEPVEHTPFEPDNLGPWPKGEPLGITLGEWFQAGGKGTYSCQDGEGTLDLTFTKLVPNGVYTVWHAFMAWPPTEPFIGTYDLPVGARDGSQSVFVADANGNAVVERTFKPCLQLTGEHLAAELAIVYHSDGKTYGPLPGEFASDSHVHLYVGLPKRSGI